MFYGLEAIAYDAESHEKLKKLVDLIKDYFFILQSFSNNPNSHYDHYFYNFYDLDLPNKEEIKNNITSIFISLLINKNKLLTDSFQSVLLARINAFFGFLHDYCDLESIYKLVLKMDSIEPTDLLNNIPFWCYIQRYINELKENSTIGNQLKTRIKLEINYIDSAWTIYIGGDSISVYDSNKNKNLALIFFCLIIKSKIVDSSIIDAVTLYNEGNNIAGFFDRKKSIDDYEATNQCSNTIRNRFKDVNERTLNEFIDKYIDFHHGYYYFDKSDEFEITINHPQIKVNC